MPVGRLICRSAKISKKYGGNLDSNAAIGALHRSGFNISVYIRDESADMQMSKDVYTAVCSLLGNFAFFYGQIGISSLQEKYKPDVSNLWLRLLHK